MHCRCGLTKRHDGASVSDELASVCSFGTWKADGTCLSASLFTVMTCSSHSLLLEAKETVLFKLSGLVPSGIAPCLPSTQSANSLITQSGRTAPS